jgi:ribokinase
MSSIAVIGSVNLDLVATVKKLPEPGETVTDAELNRFPGGKGANQALAAQRLGADVRLIACVGGDATADEALALLKEGGVDLSGVLRTPDAPTGTALIAVEPSGENHIVVAPGANRELTTDVLEVPEADALICQLEVPPSSSTKSRRHGMATVFLQPRA